MYAEETYYLAFNQSQPIPNDKIGLGSNDVIQTCTTRDIKIYPYFNNPVLDMTPPILWVQNIPYANPVVLFRNCCMLSLASRDGGYYFLDLPLSQFVENLRVHKNLHFAFKVDFENSYVRFNELPFTPNLPWVIPFVFQLWDKEENYKRR